MAAKQFQHAGALCSPSFSSQDGVAGVVNQRVGQQDRFAMEYHFHVSASMTESRPFWFAVTVAASH
jgi:hypothetical protein